MLTVTDPVNDEISRYASPRVDADDKSRLLCRSASGDISLMDTLYAFSFTRSHRFLQIFQPL